MDLWASRFSCKKAFVLLAQGDDAKGAAAVIVVAGGEEELVGIAIGAGALAELNSPNIVDLDYLPARVAEWA